MTGVDTKHACPEYFIHEPLPLTDDFDKKVILPDRSSPVTYLREYRNKNQWSLVCEFADDAGTVIETIITHCPKCGRNLTNCNTSGISERKLKHSLGVARMCEKLAKKESVSKTQQDACFVMGFLHDIGYEHANTLSEHPEISYEMIHNAILYEQKILSAIRNHGTKYDNLSFFDKILNTADLMIDHEGNTVTIEERLSGIKNRHGEDSIHYQHAKQQADIIKNNIFSSKII